MKNQENKENFLSENIERLIRSYRTNTRSHKDEVFESLLDEIEGRQYTPSQQISWYKTAVAVAATALILVSIWFFTATETINVSVGETFAFRLPDSSRVVLNDGSSLSYRKHLWRRNVKLTGQAYFEVQKGKGFLVQSNLGDVHVLGTRFLVRESENVFIVHCYQGKVKTIYDENSWILDSGKRFSTQSDVAGIEHIGELEEYPGFAKFNSNFSNSKLTEVVLELEQFFGVSIHFKDLQDKRFSGAIQTGNLENALKIICEPLQLNFNIEDNLNITIH